MQTPLSFCLVAAVAGALACSDEGGASRNSAGSGGQNSTGSSGAGGGGTSSVAGSAGTGAGSERLAPALTITGSGDNIAVTDASGMTGISGAAIVVQSMVLTTAAVNTSTDGKLCMRGATAIVPDANSYGTHWGAQLALDLKRGDAPGGGDAGAATGSVDAGADAGDAGPAPLGMQAQPWPYGDVIGFTYKITGNDPAILPATDKGVSGGAAFRFKGFPVGGDNDLDNYCSTRSPIDGATERVLISDLQFQCWETAPVNPTLADDPITYGLAGGMESTRPNPRALLNIAWQIPADITVAHRFDFCITDLQPILAPE